MSDTANKKETRPLSVDIASAIIHGSGFLLSIAALVTLVVAAAAARSPYMLVGVSMWGAALIYRYLFSTLYHALNRTGSAPIFRVLDHTGEYIVVAASFAPLCLMPDRGFSAYLVFGAVWVAAVFGIIFSSVYFGRFRWLPLAMLVAFAWLCVISLPLFRARLAPAFPALAAGWFAYLIGTIFYMNEKSAMAHVLWHSISLIATVSLYFGTLLSLAA